MNRSDAREPLLKNDERQAVNNLLTYLEKGMPQFLRSSLVVVGLHAFVS